MNRREFMSAPHPTQSFWSDPAVVRDLSDKPVMPVSHHGRQGWHTESLETRVAIPAPQLNEPRGSLTWWFLPREDFATSVTAALGSAVYGPWSAISSSVLASWWRRKVEREEKRI